MEWLQNEGVPVIYEIDDLLTDPASHLISANELKASAPIVSGMLRAADHVSASTPRLVAHLAPMSRAIALIPNYGPVDHEGTVSHDEGSIVTLVVAATDRQLIESMAAGIKLAQADPSLHIEIVAIAAIADCLEEAGLKCRRIETKPRDEFFKFLAGLVNPIGLIPLDGSSFSACKSAIKYFDYSCLGIPCICSNFPPYADVIRNRQDGVLCDDRPEAWFDAIRYLAVDGSRRVGMASAAREKTKSYYTLAHTREEWRKLIQRMFEKSAVTRKPVPTVEWLSDHMVALFTKGRKSLRNWNRRRVNSRRALRVDSN